MPFKAGCTVVWTLSVIEVILRNTMKTILNFLRSKTALFLTLGIVPLFEMLVTVEWANRSCTIHDDGPVYAATGFPLPYEIYSGVSSLEFYFMPHVYIFNLLLLCLCGYLLINLMVKKITRFRIALSCVGFTFFILIATLQILMVEDGFLVPTKSIAILPYENYLDFRPIAISTEQGVHDCKPSSFWFSK